MTIPMNNWCNDCDEACHGHATICTVCGSTLGAPPPRESRSNGTTNEETRSAAAATTITQRMVVGDAILDDMRQASQDLREILSNLQGQVQNLDSLTRNIMVQQQQLQERQQQQQLEWQAVPAHVMDVGTSGSKSRPTSKVFLTNIPRIVLTKQSTLLRQATIQVTMPSSYIGSEDKARKSANIPTQTGSIISRLSCVLGEFGPTREFRLDGMSLVQCSPITGKGGISNETKAYMSELFSRPQNRFAGNNGSDYVVAFMQRGDGLTFVEKALMAQRAGASAVIIGNTMSNPWPYVMKDFKGEAKENGLMIPVAMVKEADSKLLLEAFQQQQKQLHQKQLLLQQLQLLQQVSKKGPELETTTATIQPTTNAATNCCSLPCSLRITAHGRDCAVCCEALVTSEKVIQIPGCGHIFHEWCALMWLESHNTCPSCRLELPTDDIEYEQERARRQRTHAGGTETVSGTTADWNQFYG